MEKIKAHYNNNLQGKHFTFWELTVKPNTDDIREEPVMANIDALTKAGATITKYDPEAITNVKAQIGDKIQYATKQYDALQNATAFIVATE